MPTVCNLPKLPRKPTNGDEVCDKYGNRWRYSETQDSWISRGALHELTVVTESNNGVITPDILDQLSKVRTFANSGIEYKPLKLLPGKNAYWYYFRSSDKFVKFRPEGEDALRIEIDRGRFFQVIMKQVCPGPRGEKGDDGDRGRKGRPGPAEICYEPIINGGKLDFSIITPTPLLGADPDIELPNNHVPDISVRLFEVTYPRANSNVITTSKISKKFNQPTNELRAYDPLQHLAIYYHGMPEQAKKFQATRELLVQQSLGATTENVCEHPLNRVLVAPIGTVVDRIPVVTVLVDPLGLVPPRVTFDPAYPVDTEKTLETVKYSAETGIVCGSVYLQNNAVWDGDFCLKSRQRGPDGVAGADGEMTIKIVECSIDSSSVVATCPIISARLDCERQTIFTVCSDIMDLICVENVRVNPSGGVLNDLSATNSSFAAAQMVLDECKFIERYKVNIREADPDQFDIDFGLPHWEPQPGCATRRHYNRHKFDWIDKVNTLAPDATAKIYNQSGEAADPVYPWQILVGKQPAKDECCQEDFFYCPNVQAGGCFDPGDAAAAQSQKVAAKQSLFSVQVSASLKSVKIDQPTVLTATTTGGVGPFTYEWSGHSSSSEQSFEATFQNPGTKSIIVTVTDSHKNKAVGRIFVTVND